MGLSPPPMRRASPPASSTPGMPGAPLGVAGVASVIAALALALVPRRLFLDIVEILVVDDALLARQRDEALAAGAADQCQPDLPREVDAPRGKAGSGDKDGNPHPHRLDHHLRSEAPGRVH